MAPSKARENILHKIGRALRERVDIPFPQEEDFHIGFTGDNGDLQSRFSKEFTAHQGKLITCAGKKDLLNNLGSLVAEKKWKNISCQHPALLKDLQSAAFINNVNGNEPEVGITDCECLVARTGSVLLSTSQASGRTLPVSVPVHLVIATANQLVFDINDAIKHIKKKYAENFPSALFFASGPSRTGDIERTLVIGVHGPVEVYILLVE
ncbi:MAG: LUD domain-containing protein [Cyclobacteriaceae bacterium]